MTKKAYIATVGMFDGVHRGHAYLLERLSKQAETLGLGPMAITFDAHPKTIVSPEGAPQLLSTTTQRKDWLTALGMERVEVLHTDKACLGLSGREFLAMLKRNYGVAAFMMGYDNRIGRDRAGAAELTDACMPVFTAPQLPSETANSSAARAALAECDFDRLERMLGRRYAYRGLVTQGKRLGRTIGFPTANISPAESGIMLPPTGVYAVEATLPDGSRHGGMANIGRRPTVDVEGAPMSFEVNLFDYCGTLYGTTLDIAFVGRLRDERRFNDLETLRRQLEADRDAAKKFLDTYLFR